MFRVGLTCSNFWSSLTVVPDKRYGSFDGPVLQVQVKGCEVLRLLLELSPEVQLIWIDMRFPSNSPCCHTRGSCYYIEISKYHHISGIYEGFGNVSVSSACNWNRRNGTYSEFIGRMKTLWSFGLRKYMPYALERHIQGDTQTPKKKCERSLSQVDCCGETVRWWDLCSCFALAGSFGWSCWGTSKCWLFWRCCPLTLMIYLKKCEGLNVWDM